MYNIPLTYMSNFFDDPDKIRQYALSLQYKSDPEGRWPGQRSQELGDINPLLHDVIVNKMASIYLSSPFRDPHLCNAQMTFQIIAPNEYTREGWVHSDMNVDATAIVYLTPGGGIDNGTSFYKKRKDRVVVDGVLGEDAKKRGYTHGDVDIDQYNLLLQANNSQYEEIARVSAQYNSMVLFDGSLPHAANHFDVGGGDRLTLVAFFNTFNVGNPPIIRSKRIGVGV